MYRAESKASASPGPDGRRVDSSRIPQAAAAVSVASTTVGKGANRNRRVAQVISSARRGSNNMNMRPDMASTIAEETDNAVGVAGIAYRVKIMPIKVCLTYWELQISQSQSGRPGFVPPDAGDCPSDAIAEGIRHAANNGAKIINVSLGGPGQSLAIRSPGHPGSNRAAPIV